MTTPQAALDWNAADSAYLRHHFSCPTCCAAGMAAGDRARCTNGQALWDAYQLAGLPPHFKWIKPLDAKRSPNKQPSPASTSARMER